MNELEPEAFSGDGAAASAEHLAPWSLSALPAPATRRVPKRVWVGLSALVASFGMFVSGLGAPAGAAVEAEAGTTTDYSITTPAMFTGTVGQRTGSASRAAARATLDARASNVATAVVPGAATSVRMETRTEVEEYERIEQENPNRFADLGPVTVQAGQVGQVTRVYRYVEQDGAAVGTPVLEIVAAERLDHIVEIGTRARPVAPAAPVGGYGGGHGYLVDGGIPESVWVALAQCESGGRSTVISAGGRFHGLYQFSVATWRSVGGQGLPSQATPYEQRYRAVRLQARSGWGQWPACSRRIGVR